ncbi:MAG: polyprenyl synthetase family protein [Candidatus Diapherotrites archaeon]|nr:polyprenyl synthetase family protein [Candidatus Diapherotrites archaeon]
MISKKEAGMPIREFLASKGKIIDKEMEKYIPRKATKKWVEGALGKTGFEWDLEAYTKVVNEPIWDLLDRGGKRWRPVLACICCEAVGGKWGAGLKVAPIVELIHNGTLMIDDIEDDSVARRGKLCTHKLFGIDVAIDAGNLMYYWPMAPIYANRFKLSEKQQKQIYELYLQEMLRVNSGQALDIMWHRGNFLPSEKQYLQMCLGKTGVLAGVAAQLGAIMGNAPKKQSDALRKYGQIIGVGFQIQDDILELIGQEFKKKKGSIGGDIYEGKRTLIVIRTLEKASKEDRERLIKILDSHTIHESEIQEALDIINKYDGIQYSKKVAEKLVLGAWKDADKVLKESNAKTVLKKFAEYLIERKI